MKRQCNCLKEGEKKLLSSSYVEGVRKRRGATGHQHSSCSRRRRDQQIKRLNFQQSAGGQKVTFINLWIRWHSLGCLLSKTTDAHKGAGTHSVSASPLSFCVRESRVAQGKHWSWEGNCGFDNWHRSVCVWEGRFHKNHSPIPRSTKAPLYTITLTWDQQSTAPTGNCFLPSVGNWEEHTTDPLGLTIRGKKTSQETWTKRS